MATRIGDGVSTFYSAYNNALNNKINAQKAYIDSYNQGINARNAINDEARVQDLYYTNTKPLNASNLAPVLLQNKILTDIYGNPAYQKNMVDTSLSSADLAAMLSAGANSQENRARQLATQGNQFQTAQDTSKFNVNQAKYGLSTQDLVNQNNTQVLKNTAAILPDLGKAEQLAIQNQILAAQGLPPLGTPTTPTGIDATKDPTPAGGGTTPPAVVGATPPAPVEATKINPRILQNTAKINKMISLGFDKRPEGAAEIKRLREENSGILVDDAINARDKRQAETDALYRRLTEKPTSWIGQAMNYYSNPR